MGKNDSKGMISLPCRWDGSVIIVTIVVLLTFAAMFFLDSICPGIDAPSWYKPFIILLVLISVVGTLLYMPIRLNADAERVWLQKGFGTLRITMDEILEVRLLEKNEIKGALRLFGSGGFLGYLGNFWNRSLGRYCMYATDLNSLILIITPQRKYIFSCTLPNEFVDFVQTRIR